MAREILRITHGSGAVERIKVGVLSLDDPRTACGYLRLTAPLSYLAAQGRFEFLSVCHTENGSVKLNEENLQQAQLIIVQRGMPASVPYDLLRAAVKNPSARIIFELDDALTLVPANNPHVNYFQSIRPQIEEYLRNADLVTVSTPKLKAVYSCYNDRIQVLPNTIDTKLWLPVSPASKQDKKISILFSGTLTHHHDLALIERAIELIIEEFGDRVEFLFWGNLPATLQGKPQVRKITNFTPDYRQYVEGMKSMKIDLALVPLEGIPFNQTKSNIKWLEYSACKIPAIFTDIEPYNQSVEHGKTGWLVSNTVEAWREAIKKLMLDEGLRLRIAETAHQTVLEKHSLSANAALWMNAYEKVLASPPKASCKDEPETSIVIPVFNKLGLTRNCLSALQKNTPQGAYEIIVVDNASTDGTIAFLEGEEKAGRARVLLNRENGGFAMACNQGAQAARGQYILFLNNDTEVHPGWLDALTAAVRRPQTGIVGAKLLYGNGLIQHAGICFIGGVPDHPHRHSPADAPEVNQFRELDMVTGACLMIRRQLFLQLAGFDESYRNGVEDIDLCLRVRAAGWKIVYEPKAVVSHLEGQTPGRFNHVGDNLKIFFDRWGKSFDSQKRFVAPKTVKTIASRRSLLLSAEPLGGEKKIAVAWEGTFLDFGSLSHVNREVAKCLATQNGIELNRIGELAPSKQASSKTTQVTVRHQWPPNWDRPKQGALVIIQPWEFGALPSLWVKLASNVDEFWVPSNYVRKVYTDSGIPAEKVVVIPNGVDPAQYRPGIDPLKLATNKSFRFLFVGGTIKRKGPDVLLQAYLDAFTAADDVCLVIKDFGGDSFYRGQTFEKEIAAARLKPNAPEILYLNKELPPAEMPGLYAACHCLVHPYRGEGFGMPVLEAMACGLPVVVTRGGSTDDFVFEEAGWFIDAFKKSIGSNIGAIPLVAEGWWLEPNVFDLTEKLKYIASHSDEAKARGNRGAETVRAYYSWEHIAEKMKTRLRRVAAKAAPAIQPPKQIVAIELPPAALLGHLGPAREALKRKDYRAAWNLADAALKIRPFHPEAWLILAESAQAAGAVAQSKRCLERGRKLAPNWKPLQALPKKKSGATGKGPAGWPAAPETLAAPRLTVCLITKNEEQFIGQCLKSVRDIAHQIIVVDTGSADRTVEIAREHNAEVHFLAWNDDFSEARNEALKYATGDWVLSLDADEELLPHHRETILQEIRAAGVLGYRLPIINKGREEEGCGYVPRLFCNAPGLFFVGRIHEQIFTSLDVRAREWGLDNRLGRSALLHHGYTQEIVASRHKKSRNLRLLQQAVQEMPNELSLVMNLGLELVRSGQLDAGLDQYREAVRLMSEMPAQQIVPEFREVLLTDMTKHLLTARRFQEVVELWRQPFLKSLALTASQHFILGVARMELREHADAAAQMRECLAKRSQPALSPIHPDILKSGPHHCLAVSLAGLGQDAEAEQAFRDALGQDPKSRAVRSDFAVFLFRRERSLDALKLLHELVAEDSKDISAWRLGGEMALSQPQFLGFAQDWTSEAVKHYPDDPAILLQRAEALMLNQQTALALPLWTRAHFAQSAQHLAALTLCETLEGGCQRRFPAANERLVSQEFLKWYRRLIKFKANSTVNSINQKLDELQPVLPTAVGLLGAAMKKAEIALAV
jgi:GT2 family glycosyltransferase/glycosyltransferase involved in cell wall biosynthesis/Tfp pilus assembly protein PilF